MGGAREHGRPRSQPAAPPAPRICRQRRPAVEVAKATRARTPSAPACAIFLDRAAPAEAAQSDAAMRGCVPAARLRVPIRAATHRHARRPASARGSPELAFHEGGAWAPPVQGSEPPRRNVERHEAVGHALPQRVRQAAGQQLGRVQCGGDQHMHPRRDRPSPRSPARPKGFAHAAAWIQNSRPGGRAAAGPGARPAAPFHSCPLARSARCSAAAAKERPATRQARAGLMPASPGRAAVARRPPPDRRIRRRAGRRQRAAIAAAPPPPRSAHGMGGLRSALAAKGRGNIIGPVPRSVPAVAARSPPPWRRTAPSWATPAPPAGAGRAGHRG